MSKIVVVPWTGIPCPGNLFMLSVTEIRMIKPTL